MMRHAWCLLVVIAGIGCAPSSGDPKTEPEPNAASSGPKHPVTDRMAKVAEKWSRNEAHDFSLISTTHDEVKLHDLLKRGPVVVVAIKDGCPCSIDAQPLFNALAKRYAGVATFVGLFDQDLANAKAYVKDNSVPFPVVLDTRLTASKAFKAERSVYTTLVAPDGIIVKQWPGYWTEMLADLDTRLGKLTGKKLKAFDTAYAPKVPTSGCQLFEGEGFAPGDVR